jgi:hypothetical protein
VNVKFKRMPLKISASIDIRERPEIVFDYTQNYAHRLEWDTFLLEARLLPPYFNAQKGAKAWCVAINGYGMETEYISFARPKVTAIRMTKGPYMFKEFSGSWNFKEISELTTTVVFTYSFSLRFPYNIFGFYIRKNLQKNVQQRLIDLKTHLEQKNEKSV